MKQRATNITKDFPDFIGEHCGRDPTKIIESVILLTNAKRARARSESPLPWSWAAFAPMCGIEPGDEALLDAQAVKPYRAMLKRCRTPEALRKSEEHLLQQCRHLPEPLAQTFSEMIGWWTADNREPIIPLTTETLKQKETYYRKGILSLDELQESYLYSLFEGGGLSDWLDRSEAEIDLIDFNPTISTDPKLSTASGVRVTTYARTVGAINYRCGVAGWVQDPKSCEHTDENPSLGTPRVNMYSANIRSACRNYCQRLYFRPDLTSEYRWLAKIKTTLRLNNLEFFHWLQTTMSRWFLAHEIGHISTRHSIDAFEARTGENVYRGIRAPSLLQEWEEKKKELSELLANLRAARSMSAHDPVNSRRYMLFLLQHLNGAKPEGRKPREAYFYSRYGNAALAAALTQPDWPAAINGLQAQVMEKLDVCESYDQFNRWLKEQEHKNRKRVYEYLEMRTL